jgi:hypothetical protein
LDDFNCLAVFFVIPFEKLEVNMEVKFAKAILLLLRVIFLTFAIIALKSCEFKPHSGSLNKPKLKVTVSEISAAAPAGCSGVQLYPKVFH